ncbi:MAG: TetR/AcrR family transcriptional regulator, partial [Phenylobacterium sp.]|nr:TetR/AcrR family transcriptional regulator [Phenylobacterium sp.]
MRKGEATRGRIIDCAARLAAVRGLTAVSLGDVADAVGLSKSGLFKHFESKDAMQMAVVEAVMERFGEIVWKPAETHPPGRGRLEAVFEHWLHWCENEWAESGCPIMQLTTELDDQPGPPREYLHMGLGMFRAAVIREFQA